MRRLWLSLLACLAASALAAAPAQAHYPSLGNFGLNGFDITFAEAGGTPEVKAGQAGSHPFAVTASFASNLDSEGEPEGWLKDLFIEQIPGLLGDTNAYPRCTTLEFLKLSGAIPACPVESAVGVTTVEIIDPGNLQANPIFNLTPPPGVLLRLGFRAAESENVFIDVGLNPSPPYNGIAALRNIPQLVPFFGSKTQLWGNPSDPAHNGLRGACGNYFPPSGPIEDFEFEDHGEVSCPVAPLSEPFLTLPTYCGEPLASAYEAFSWAGEEDFGESLTHEAGGGPAPLGGCEKLNFKPSLTAQPTNRAAGSPTGMDLSIDVKDEGLTSTKGLSQSRIRRVAITLPKGMTANPSLAEGLEACSEADLEAETLSAAPGEGCPQASKVGTVAVDTPLVEEPLEGSLFIAEPFKNPFHTLLAIYVVVKSQKLGIIVKQPTEVLPDPKTGQLVGIAEDIPQTAAFSHLRLHLREGGRSPLVSPPGCGTFQAKAEMTPWSGGSPITSTSDFEIVSGPNEGPCPPSGTPPFEPGFDAGSKSNAAGATSPFAMRLTRRDGDQDLTRFDVALPPGVGGILAGIDRCPDAQIALAKAKTGKAELASPSCPANSKIGTVWGGAGVGSQLTYVPGSLYLAGPFGGEPLSVVGIVPAVAGPFDVGTVVVRQALRIDPRTGEASVDGAHSDPIPHILAGIPLVVRDIQVSVDRPNFTYNPTSCDPFATRAQIWGGGADPFSTLDNSPVPREARFQAASCQSLGFKPRLDLRLRGGTRRAAFPALRFLYRPRKGDANLSDLALRFPHSEFIEQGHFRTICTRVQFAAGAGNGAECPSGSVYGHVRVFTPILSEPLSGPVFLRSSSHNLPDVVLALHGPPSLPIELEVPSRIDSVHGGLRVIAGDTPDAPVSKVVLDMQGGQKGLFVNSTDLCREKHRAHVSLTAHNGKDLTLRPPLRVSCAKHRRR